jgi:hypothetical protein
MYKTLAVPILLYGSETWTLKEQDKSRITAAEMTFLKNKKIRALYHKKITTSERI